jgi:hypothetical protein
VPNLSFLHVSINLDTPEGREIHDSLSKVPERQRSMVVRAALLSYFKGAEGGEKQSRKQKAKQVKPEPNRQLLRVESTVPSSVPIATATEDGCGSEVERSQQTRTSVGHAENRLKDLLKLMQ